MTTYIEASLTDKTCIGFKFGFRALKNIYPYLLDLKDRYNETHIAAIMYYGYECNSVHKLLQVEKNFEFFADVVDGNLIITSEVEKIITCFQNALQINNSGKEEKASKKKD